MEEDDDNDDDNIKLEGIGNERIDCIYVD